MKIGFIGLGNVGEKLAKSLIRNNFDVTVRDIEKKLTDKFKQEGVSISNSAKEKLGNTAVCDNFVLDFSCKLCLQFHYYVEDLLWVTKFMNISSLAIYTTAQIFFKQSNQISSSIGSVFETRIIQYYGKYKSWKKIGEIIKNYMYLQLLVFVPILVCFCATFIPLIIRQFLPKYQDANQAIIYLLLANFFIVTNSGLTIPWFTKKKLISRGISNLLGLSLMIFFLCFFWFVLEKQDLISISISVTLSYLFYFIYMLIMVGKELWFTNEIFKICFTIIIAAIWTGFVVHLGYYYSIDGLNIFSDIIRSIIVFILSLIGISPIFIFGLKASNYSKFIKILD